MGTILLFYTLVRGKRGHVNKDSFAQFVEEQLQGMDDIVFRSMFGGWGIYRDETFFGIVHDGKLFFKTYPGTRAEYEARGMAPFAPFGLRRTAKLKKPLILKNYLEVPIDILEDRDQLHAWACAASQRLSSK